MRSANEDATDISAVEHSSSGSHDEPLNVGTAQVDSTVDRCARSGRDASGAQPVDGQIESEIRGSEIELALSVSAAEAPQVHLHLILTDRALLGLSDEPAEMIGHGTVPAQLARRLAVTGAGRPDDARTTLRRYLTDPVTGRLSDCDPRVRFFPDVMKEFLMVRDRVCRTPWCSAPIREGDHVVRRADGGPTTVDNGQGLCRLCNLVKESGSEQIGRWSSRPQPDGTIVITTPTGHRYLSPEPPATHDPDRPPA